MSLIERVFDVIYCHCSRCRKATGGRYYSVHVGTLDDPEQAPPRIHQCIETKLGWLALADDLPRVAGNTLPHRDTRRPRRTD